MRSWSRVFEPRLGARTACLAQIESLADLTWVQMIKVPLTTIAADDLSLSIESRHLVIYSVNSLASFADLLGGKYIPAVTMRLQGLRILVGLCMSQSTSISFV